MDETIAKTDGEVSKRRVIFLLSSVLWSGHKISIKTKWRSNLWYIMYILRSLLRYSRIQVKKNSTKTINSSAAIVVQSSEPTPWFNLFFPSPSKRTKTAIRAPPFTFTPVNIYNTAELLKKKSPHISYPCIVSSYMHSTYFRYLKTSASIRSTITAPVPRTPFHTAPGQ